MNSLLGLLLALAPQTPLVSQAPAPTEVNDALRSVEKIQVGGTVKNTDPRTAINSRNTPGDADSLYRISKPGSYYLTKQLKGVAGKRGIEIAAQNVEIDLMGFTLAGGVGTLEGIIVVGSVIRSARVHHGAVVGWGGSGVDLFSAAGSSVSDLRAVANGNLGVSVGEGGLICNVSSIENLGSGVTAGPGSSVQHTTSRNNQNSGFSLGEGTAVSNSSASLNRWNGFYANSGASFQNCSSASNGSMGFYIAGGSTLTACTAYENGAYGISILNGGATIVDCITNSNAGSGIFAPKNSVIRGCAAAYNAENGMQISSGGQILNSSAASNGRSGFLLGSGAMVRDNVATDNGLNGFELTGPQAILIKNTARSNAYNYFLGSNGNQGLLGPIVSATGIMSASTHPLSNFSF